MSRPDAVEIPFLKRSCRSPASTYSAHAEQRMREWSIGRIEIEATLRHADAIVPAKEDKRRATRTNASGVLVTVIVAETPNAFGSSVHVVTVC